MKFENHFPFFITCINNKEERTHFCQLTSCCFVLCVPKPHKLGRYKVVKLHKKNSSSVKYSARTQRDEKIQDDTS